MQASDIINLVIDLSLGQNDVSEEERAKFIGYLRLALIDFYTRTASMNEACVKTFTQDVIDERTDIALTDTTGRPTPLLFIKEIITPTFRFDKRVSWCEMQARKFLNQHHKPVYCVQDNRVTLYSGGRTPYRIFIAYVPAFTNELKASTDLSIFIPVQWQNLLIYGTLYYIYQDMDGFKSSVKESIAAQEWQAGLSRCVAALFNASQSSIGKH